MKFLKVLFSALLISLTLTSPAFAVPLPSFTGNVVDLTIQPTLIHFVGQLVIPANVPKDTYSNTWFRLDGKDGTHTVYESDCYCQGPYLNAPDTYDLDWEFTSGIFGDQIFEPGTYEFSINWNGTDSTPGHIVLVRFEVAHIESETLSIDQVSRKSFYGADVWFAPSLERVWSDGTIQNYCEFGYDKEFEIGFESKSNSFSPWRYVAANDQRTVDECDQYALQGKFHYFRAKLIYHPDLTNPQTELRSNSSEVEYFEQTGEYKFIVGKFLQAMPAGHSVWLPIKLLANYEDNVWREIDDQARMQIKNSKASDVFIFGNTRENSFGKSDTLVSFYGNVTFRIVYKNAHSKWFTVKVLKPTKTLKITLDSKGKDLNYGNSFSLCFDSKSKYSNGKYFDTPKGQKFVLQWSSSPSKKSFPGTWSNEKFTISSSPGGSCFYSLYPKNSGWVRVKSGSSASKMVYIRVYGS